MNVGWLVTKYATTALLVVVISEVARRNDRLGGLVASLPWVTLLAMLWMWFEKLPSERIANHAWYTFWYVVPTLPMFLVLPWAIPRWGFWPALAFSSIVSLACFVAFALVVRRFGIELLP